jgi:hypothetical protein
MVGQKKILLKGGIKGFMNNKEELINRLKDFTEVIKNCNSDCDNCEIYETCIEKYSDENLINLLNEAIEYIKETEN